MDEGTDEGSIQSQKAAFQSGVKEACNAGLILKSVTKEVDVKMRLERDQNTNNSKDTVCEMQSKKEHRLQMQERPIIRPSWQMSFMLALISSRNSDSFKSVPLPEDWTLSKSTARVRRILSSFKINKAAGPDNIIGCAQEHVPIS